MSIMRSMGLVGILSLSVVTEPSPGESVSFHRSVEAGSSVEACDTFQSTSEEEGTFSASGWVTCESQGVATVSETLQNTMAWVDGDSGGFTGRGETHIGAMHIASDATMAQSRSHGWLEFTVTVPSRYEWHHVMEAALREIPGESTVELSLELVNDQTLETVESFGGLYDQASGAGVQITATRTGVLEPGTYSLEVMAVCTMEFFEAPFNFSPSMDAIWQIDFTFTPGPPEDVTGDGYVGVDDMLAVLVAWGPCNGCFEDIDHTGEVDVYDLLRVIAAWGG